MKSYTVLIPAYQPDEKLFNLVKQLQDKNIPVIIVNDGSTQQVSHDVFKKCKELSNITLLNHAHNLGKGAALKTGFNHFLLKCPNQTGVVTADADGQHLVKDILNVGNNLVENPESLVLGTRVFSEDVPFRSKFGNVLTGIIFNFFTGIKLNDTQTGLRGVSKEFISEFLKLESNGYEYEMDCLFRAQANSINFLQVPIETVYIENNKSSHFNPLVDSFKIYFVLFRFSASSALTAILDFIVFSLGIALGQTILLSQISARIVAGVFNYYINREYVFKSTKSVSITVIKYILLVLINLTFSYLGIIWLIDMGLSVLTSKILVETTLYFASFAVQRTIIFNK